LEIDDITRFGAAPKLAAYAGLVPSTYASGGKIFHGHLIHMSNKMASMGSRGSGLGCNAQFSLLQGLF